MMDPQNFQTRLLEALHLDLPYGEPMRSKRSSQDHREAAVLLLFGFSSTGEPHLLMTQRAHHMESHRGQMAFPGGIRENEDGPEGQFETLQNTALRETEEEIGLPAENIQLLGALPALSTVVTGFWVTPMVGLLHSPSIEEVVFQINAEEIAKAYWIPLGGLLAPETYRTEKVGMGSVKFSTHVFYWNEDRIWGATGAMIRNLLDRLNSVQ